jgi:hypothetical protein
VVITDVETPTSDQSVLQLLQARRILPVALVIPLITAVPHRLEEVVVAPLAEEVVVVALLEVAAVAAEAPSEVEVAAVVVAPSVEDDNFL